MKKTLKLISLLAGGILITCTSFGQSVKDGTYDVSGHNMIIDVGVPGYSGWEDCATCHTDQQDFIATHIQDIMNSVHWTWEMDDGQGTVGKYNVINNYCVAVKSNEPRCTSCHIGVGWKDSNFDRNSPDHIDCMICHDQTGTYKKNPTGAGAPLNADTLDYAAIVRSFGTPDRDNCGACHFYGGGGEGVKHGTMDSSLSMPDEATDVHMANGMNCVDCHGYEASNEVAFKGSRYNKDTHDAQMCIDCHSDASSGAPDPSQGGHTGMIPYHLGSLSCQSCHVPALARGGKATKTYWDWETASNRQSDGTDRVIRNGDGDIVYHSKKGTFVWGYDIVPQYEWSNGGVTHITVNDVIDPAARNHINVFEGAKGNGLLFPVKKFVGRQPYDEGTDKLVVPHLFPTADEVAGTQTMKAYWKKYDWALAAEAGQEISGGPAYSGQGVGFVETDFTWIANHMVAPKTDVVECWECHKSKDRFDRAALGLTETQTDEFNVLYAGYRIMYESTDPQNGPDPNGYAIINTGAYMGLLEVSQAPWIYSYNMGKYLYIPEEGGGLFGSWTYMPK